MTDHRFRLALPAWLAVLCCLVLSACGDLPEPFLGNPGATARRLAQPLTTVLAVPPGTDTLLTDEGNRELARQVALALQASEVPATVRQPQKTDWRLIITAHLKGGQVTPVFSVQDPNGKEQGSAVGEPVPLQRWAQPDKVLFQQVAGDAGSRVGAVLTSIRIARDMADPNSLYNRPARVLVADVKGAPGDGNAALTRNMRSRLAALGPVVLTTPSGADFVVQGEVKVVPIPGKQERVEIVWTINTGAGDERGKVVQLNEIPAGTLDRYWGDVAVVVASEAAGGVNSVIRRQAGHEPNESKPATSGQPATPAATPAGASAAPVAAAPGTKPNQAPAPAAASPTAGSPATTAKPPPR